MGCREHRSQPQVVNRWKSTFLEQARTVFERAYGQTEEQQWIAEPSYCDRNDGLVYNVTVRPEVVQRHAKASLYWRQAVAGRQRRSGGSHCDWHLAFVGAPVEASAPARRDGRVKAKPHPGRPLRLTPQQKASMRAIQLNGPQAAGFTTRLWTLARVAQVIERHSGVRYHPADVWCILREMGWSPQEPEWPAR